jgi:hypothetical protein
MQVGEIHPPFLAPALPLVQARGLHTRIVNLKTAPDREAVADRILGLNDVVFYDQVRSQTRDDEVWVMLFETATGDLVSYNCIRIAHIDFEGRAIACWRSRAALLPSYRGHNRTAHFPAILFAMYRLRHPLRQIYGFIGLVHPSSFKLFVKGMPSMYPYGSRELSPADQRMHDHLWNWLGLQAVSGRAPFVMQGKTSTRISADETAYWAKSEDPSVRFFLLHNPDYLQGQAIMSFFKIDLKLFLGIGWRMLNLRGRFRRLLGGE